MHQDFFPPGIAVLTGAGISKESGIDTFRDADGLWNRVNLEEVATLEAWHRDKKKVLDFYNETRSMFRAAGIGPNEAHRALARLEREYDGEVTIITQNIDLLHEQAGSKRVIHMHGRDGEIRCMACKTVFSSDYDLTPASICPHCNSVGELRPNIVWFGEMPIHLEEIYEALERCGLFLAIGTSGEVYPAAGFVLHVRRHAPRARTVELNLEPTDNKSLFHEHIYGPATETVPPYVTRVLTQGWR
ncbi:NAD-dependent deacylase [Reyranella sp.]|jgi:NAD-dependent deacetylase|uniref:NAD-dependent deacylase n=1 Tax=Reyranella sp. TaxID=1929291 RepID=UPI000BCA7A58|nr:NAD-dependent deacylase [Reyranella sp.]OYY44830.1 MAG: NAD-dependent protein deacylase [Rhodospirillales bacterium 35-66-84]OYZ95332.1 MAG: NAD-dependent protein deacylase [Rhodospirillales bacterium 24-66-33]OZB26893.1 MAG: NAD-dependent protein deacylase [Rhodospirillales bacterium 39-66-50]HQS16079.1 NAD-dependent deacylase [Reyranella sp.]HQT11675.1 NAD-dependent deacylase [Reyranella sp.]